MDFGKSILSVNQRTRPQYHQQYQPRMAELKLSALLFIVIHFLFLVVTQASSEIPSIRTISISLRQIPVQIVKIRHHITRILSNHKSTPMAREVVHRANHQGIVKVTMGSPNISNKDLVMLVDHQAQVITRQIDIRTLQTTMSTTIPATQFMPLRQMHRDLESKLLL
jgi:hypothetical protein